MELWGGIECTVTRVGTRTFDQLERCGHYDRIEDLDRIAALGIARMRYPLLWEKAATSTPEEYDLAFAEERLCRLRDLGVTPIAGLVHHGCGPAHTNLLDDGFAPGLAHYASSVARRFPWLEWYTPVNEPLTTARFSGLYGHWHPHERSDRAFARILINECRAIVLAMRAIREVNPAAKLVQTDDLGTIYATPALRYQADFENERRWLGWDLLAGRVDVTHPMHEELETWGVSDRELGWFVENPCPAEVIGIDHYVTSDRFLDEDVDRYPARCRGGNGRQRYADVEAVRVLERPGTSLRDIVLAAARRYDRPVALTEVHLGCAEDEQVRWLHEAWTTCEQLAARGAPVCAVTSWALLGCYDWDTLMTTGGDTYESGAFCLRGGRVRATQVARYIQTLTSGGDVSQLPALKESGEGWWRRPERWLARAGVPDFRRTHPVCHRYGEDGHPGFEPDRSEAGVLG
jgi:dTDP-4-dehydrorhamnose reductase